MMTFFAVGFIYVPAGLLGRYAADHGVDPYLAGWAAGGCAVLIRWLIAEPIFKHFGFKVYS